MVCILCPMGCRLTVTRQEDGEVSVQGNTCKRGQAYGVQELLNPMRVVTSSVRLNGGRHPLCSVKTKGQVPKASIPQVLEAIRVARAQAPVHIGQVILEDVAGTGVPLVATSNVQAQ